jgi:hypothetical protein
MQHSQRSAHWLVLALCLLGLTGCSTIIDRSRGILYPPETARPAQSQPDATSEAPSITRISEATPLATLTWPVQEPSATPTPTQPPTPTPLPTATTEPTAKAMPRSPEPTKEIVARPTITETLEAGPTDTPQSPATPVATPQRQGSDGLVSLEGEAIYRGDYWGSGSEQVAAAPAYEQKAFWRGMLAAAQGSDLELIDLSSGMSISTEIGTAREVEYVELMWGAEGQHLVHGALTVEGQGKSSQRRVEIQVLDASAVQAKGELGRIGQFVLDDVASVSLLHYSEDEKRLLLVPRGEQPVFTEVRFYDVANGQLVDTYPAEGQGDALVSPDGRYLLTEQFTNEGAQFVLYDLQAQGEVRPKIWAHDKGAYSMFPLWSPDGGQIAYLLRRDGKSQDEPIEPLGLWVLDIASGKTRCILEEDSLFSSLVAWTPDGDYIVGYYEAGEGSHYYAIRPDGGDRRILPLDPQVQILGWMPLPMPTGSSAVTGKSAAIDGSAVTDKPATETDFWPSRFAATLDDPEGMV